MPNITIPEITIVGSPDSPPVNAPDWFAEGFTVGFNAPSSTPDRPLMINDELAGVFSQGVAAGQSAASDLAAEFQNQFGDQPQVVPDLGGETLEKTQGRFRKEFEGLFHQHMPHTENDTEVLEPLPTPTISLVVP
jgi:hypothetical protein